MKKHSFPKLYGLKTHFVLRAFFSLLSCALLFVVLYSGLSFHLENYSMKPEITQSRLSAQKRNLQRFVNDNAISSENIQQIRKWENKQPVILLEIYKHDACIYGSRYSEEKSEATVSTDNLSKDFFVLQLVDGPVLVYLLSDFTYQFFQFSMVFSVFISLALFIALIIIGNRKLIHYVCRLNDEVQILEGGNLEYEVSVEGNDEITDLARSMNRMRTSIKILQEERKRLVTEMSHDLRTPITGLMLYIEILKSHRYSSEKELQDYLLKIENKTLHLKMISDHLLEYTTRSSSPVLDEPMPVESLFRRPIEALANELESQGFSVLREISWPKSFVVVNRDFLTRILENISSNITKYAEPASEVRIESLFSGGFCGFSFTNICAGTESDVESHGIGIESIQNLMGKMGGKCNIERTDEMFEITLLFPVG